jgi:hypothetical protein
MKARLARRLVCCDIGSRTLEELLRQREEARRHHPARPPSGAARRGTWTAIRSDGWVLTRHGSVHIREMWQKGVDEVTIAKEIQSLAKWGEADLPAAQKDEVQARST